MKDLKCPICYKNLKVTGQARLETLDEHICNPNGVPSMKDKYECINVDCPAFIHKASWNEDGEYYIRDFKAKINFINDNNAPFGSFQRQMNVEIYKKDENYILLNLYFFKIKVEFKYKSNENGIILERKRTFLILKRDRNGIGWIHWISPIRMFLFHISQFKRELKRLDDIIDCKYATTVFEKINKDYFHDTDTRFYRKVAKFYINIFLSNKVFKKMDIVLKKT